MDQPFTTIYVGVGRYRCAFGLDQYKELERICNATTGQIYGRTSKGRLGFLEGEIYPEMAEYSVPEMWQVVRQAVIGGGQAEIDGQTVKIADFQVDERLMPYYFGISDKRLGLTKLWADAYKILHDLCHGYAPPKKAEPPKAAAKTKSSTSRRSSPIAR